MNAVVRVLPADEFEKWYAETAVTAPAESPGAVAGAAGLEIIRAQGCIACHSTDGSKIVGPSFLGLYGKTETVVRDGKDVAITADEDYIRRSIY
jgi:cytochrome c oxidase subunit 2